MPHDSLLFHSDRGSQYTADDYLALLKSYGIVASMSRKADPYDNAMMESFFATLRTELTELQRFHTRAAVDYIEVFYNRQRIHTAIEYTYPAAYEAYRHP